MMASLQALSPAVIIAIVAVFGLLFGSFLNVVIYRVPKKMDQEQDEGVAEFLEQKVTKKESLDFISLGSECPQCHHKFRWGEDAFVLPEKDRKKTAPPFNLITPASSCPECMHKIRWWENIPVLSWLFLRGKCSSCHNSISFRYPFIELLAAILFGAVAWHFGATVPTLLWCFFVFMCIAISGIDWDTTWLPDSLSLSLMWVGLIAALMGWTVPIASAIWGAIAGYMILWLLANGFKFATGRMGMANGDFKMLAALGAWFGWEFLLPILLLSSLVGAIVGITLKALQSKAGLFEGKFIPFGPFLAGAGLLLLILTPQAFQKMLPFLVLGF